MLLWMDWKLSQSMTFYSRVEIKILVSQNTNEDIFYIMKIS